MKKIRKTIDEVGNTYGKWKILSFSYKSTRGNSYWLAKCSCGREKIVQATKLRNGSSTQCLICSNTINGKLGHKPKEHLYMIQCGPYIKIGTTSNIKERLVSLRVYNPYPIRLVGFWENYGFKEKEWHTALKHLHHQGEWFMIKNAAGCEI